MRLILMLLTTIAAGCVPMTTLQMRAAVKPIQLEMVRAPYSAASCVARNIEATKDVMFGSHPAFVREGIDADKIELSVPPILVADFVVNGKGSIATVYVSPDPATVYQDRYLAAFKGC